MSKFLEDVTAFIKKNGYNIYAVAEIKDGAEVELTRIIEANLGQNSYSVAKAFVVTAIGLLCDRGLLSTDEFVTDILADEITDSARSKMDARWNSVTVDMALRHHLGLPKNFLDIELDDVRTYGEDYLAYMLTYPLVQDHGLERTYTDGAYYLLARIAEKRAGKRLDLYLWEELFYKLDFQEVAWSCCPKGHVLGATGLYVRTADMVKLGAVYLDGGVYKGQRILSEEWVKTVLERGYELRSNGFGDSYSKGGMYGQLLAVFPSQKRVVACHGYGFKERAKLLEFVSEYSDR